MRRPKAFFDRSLLRLPEATSFSYPEIGKAFGGKDHTTVMHAVKKIEILCVNDQRIEKQICDIKQSIFSI